MTENPPRLRIIKGGEPSDEELAALVAVVALRDAAPAEEPQPLRRPLSPWVASGLVKGTRTKV
ncbi:MAG TPA: acyl-CoA carboxylase epsilon subunit [Mycobacteriales bacterium]|nr:acyl-CoA carboxylase epsilon subunit [Mycobacteriales bacterium]